MLAKSMGLRHTLHSVNFAIMIFNKQLPSRVFRLHGRNFRTNSVARKRETTQYNIAKLSLPRQIMATPLQSMKYITVNSQTTFLHSKHQKN